MDTTAVHPQRHGPKLARSRPVIGHLARMRRDPLGTLVDAAKLGDVARIDLGPRGEAYLISHPDGIKRIFLDAQPQYTKQTRGFNTLRAFLGEGLLTSEGSFWRKQRRTAQPAFHHRRIQRFASLMTRAAEDLGDRWEARARSGEPFDLSDDMMRLTLRIVGECLFSIDASDESGTIGPSIDLLLKRFISRITAPLALPLHWPAPGHRAVREAIATLRTTVDEIIARRMEQGSAGDGDLLDMLMAAEDAETGERMSATQLRDEVLTLIVAGHETTAAALSWTWALLGRHPEIDARLEDQLRALPAAQLSPEALTRAPLVGQVIHESLRLYPPAWIIARRATVADEIGGVSIPAGRLVVVSPYVTHRRPDLFDDPERFHPKRFRVGEGPAGGFSRYAYYPFGAGPRICIGNGFALMESQLVLATLRRRFRLQPVAGSTLEPLPQLTLRCRDGVPVVAHAVG